MNYLVITIPCKYQESRLYETSHEYNVHIAYNNIFENIIWIGSGYDEEITQTLIDKFYKRKPTLQNVSISNEKSSYQDDISYYHMNTSTQIRITLDQRVHILEVDGYFTQECEQDFDFSTGEYESAYQEDSFGNGTFSIYIKQKTTQIGKRLSYFCMISNKYSTLVSHNFYKINKLTYHGSIYNQIFLANIQLENIDLSTYGNKTTFNLLPISTENNVNYEYTDPYVDGFIKVNFELASNIANNLVQNIKSMDVSITLIKKKENNEIQTYYWVIQLKFL